ncbi:sulfate transporter CysZ [Marinobacterium arenosum]|uniref:sulfate transporter CysZ n=1 Tax=Marinobacterium arenosum TaxID=2862496 RepID=UPI001C9546A7|nr:sulfate transporter CysZ [Marinobacterium arenosum]MBY4676539.1 sulfate transporter CysZ [Marinobacterium arenosum]
MTGNPFRGAGYLLRGLQMLPEPSLRMFVLIPLLINIVLFSGAIWLLIDQFENWVGYWLAKLPDWLSFLEWLLWPLFAVLVLIVVYYTFTLVANFIAAPFNGLLAEKVEMKLRGQVNSASGWQAALKMIPQALARELAKLRYYLPRFLFILLLTFIPLVNLASPLLWFLFGSWMMAIQYCDYPMDNNRVSFGNMKSLLKSHRLTALGFGGLVQLGMLVPVLNLILMPAAVVGATVYWVEEYAGEADQLMDLR